MQRLTEGRIVHCVMEDGEHRAAMVVRVFAASQGEANLLVFLDGLNDTDAHNGTNLECTVWMPSVKHDPSCTQPRSWHWIEGEEPS